VPPAATPGACLYVMSGPQAGQRLPLRHGFTIGKAPGCDLSLAHDGYGSTHHAQIVVDAAGGCVLVDRGSTNGTFVNGVRITEQRLFDGMAIRCGSTDLRFLQQ
jgi:pSer/pThr/pTyr-binding forkhead associated (FHA) protein